MAMIRALCRDRNPSGGFVRCNALILCKDRADLPDIDASVLREYGEIRGHDDVATTLDKEPAMRLTIEILAATLLVFCISATSAAFAAGKMGRSADGLSCGFSLPANASQAARCAAIKRQCSGKFAPNYCGDRMLSAT
jgi:hypothetical protein